MAIFVVVVRVVCFHLFSNRNFSFLCPFLYFIFHSVVVDVVVVVVASFSRPFPDGCSQHVGFIQRCRPTELR